MREGFIVDEEEEDEDVGEARRRTKKRRRGREQDEQLDEEDLDLIGEAIPDWERKPQSQVRSNRIVVQIKSKR